MESVFEVKITGTHQLNGTQERKTYLIDLGEAAKFDDAENRAKFEAKEMAFNDGIEPKYSAAHRTSDYVRCPHCGDPISSNEFE